MTAPDVRIIEGDCLAVLAGLPADSVHCVVTSPPYWGLRDYGVAGQIGLEPTLGEHLAVIVEVFRAVRRVLRPDGTVWLNYGDCYATSPNGRSAAATKAAGNDDRTFRDKPFSTIGPIYEAGYEKTSRVGVSENLGSMAAAHGGRVMAGGYLKPKDLCMVPNRLAIALQEDGWWVRSEIIWHKPNPMPESITDRPGTSHEKVFLLTKSERYFYDAAAVRTVAGERDGCGHDRVVRPPPRVARDPRHEGHINHTGLDATPRGTANLRNVWTIATKPFREAHFATFPPDLVEPCVLAGTSERGVCSACGAPWVRDVAKTFHPQADVSEDRRRREPQHPAASSRWAGSERGAVEIVTVGWHPSCQCPAAVPVAATVLDPFGGAGTVGLVASRLQRRAILIELNPEYAGIARARIQGDAPLLANLDGAAAE